MEEKKENDKLRQNIKSLEERLAKIEKFLKPQMQEQVNAEEFLRRAIELTVQYDTVSASFLQRKLAIGYARACRLMDQMEERGYISGAEDGHARKVYKKASN